MNQPGQKKNRAPKLAGSHIKLDGVDLQDDFEEDEEDERDIAGSLMEVICDHPGLVKFRIDGSLHKLREGDTRMIPATYATPVQFRPQGDPLPSVIERETGRKVLPINDPRLRRDKDGNLVALKAKKLREEAKAKQVLSGTPGQGV